MGNFNRPPREKRRKTTQRRGGKRGNASPDLAETPEPFVMGRDLSPEQGQDGMDFLGLTLLDWSVEDIKSMTPERKAAILAQGERGSATASATVDPEQSVVQPAPEVPQSSQSVGIDRDLDATKVAEGLMRLGYTEKFLRSMSREQRRQLADDHQKSKTGVDNNAPPTPVTTPSQTFSRAAKDEAALKEVRRRLNMQMFDAALYEKGSTSLDPKQTTPPVSEQKPAAQSAPAKPKAKRKAKPKVVATQPSQPKVPETKPIEPVIVDDATATWQGLSDLGADAYVGSKLVGRNNGPVETPRIAPAPAVPTPDALPVPKTVVARGSGEGLEEWRRQLEMDAMGSAAALSSPEKASSQEKLVPQKEKIGVSLDAAKTPSPEGEKVGVSYGELCNILTERMGVGAKLVDFDATQTPEGVQVRASFDDGATLGGLVVNKGNMIEVVEGHFQQEGGVDSGSMSVPENINNPINRAIRAHFEEEYGKSVSRISVGPSGVEVEFEYTPPEPVEEKTPFEWRKKLGLLVGRLTGGAKEIIRKSESARRMEAYLKNRSAQIDAGLSQQQGGFEKWFRRQGELYDKLGTKGKIALGVALGVGAFASSGVSVPAALGFSSALAVQRFYGAASKLIKGEKKLEGRGPGLLAKKERAMVSAFVHTVVMSAAIKEGIALASETSWGESVHEYLRNLLNPPMHATEAPAHNAVKGQIPRPEAASVAAPAVVPAVEDAPSAAATTPVGEVLGITGEPVATVGAPSVESTPTASAGTSVADATPPPSAVTDSTESADTAEAPEAAQHSYQNAEAAYASDSPEIGPETATPQAVPSSHDLAQAAKGEAVAPEGAAATSSTETNPEVTFATDSPEAPTATSGLHIDQTPNIEAQASGEHWEIVPDDTQAVPDTAAGGHWEIVPDDDAATQGADTPTGTDAPTLGAPEQVESPTSVIQPGAADAIEPNRFGVSVPEKEAHIYEAHKHIFVYGGAHENPDAYMEKAQQYLLLHPKETVYGFGHNKEGDYRLPIRLVNGRAVPDLEHPVFTRSLRNLFSSWVKVSGPKDFMRHIKLPGEK